MANLCYVNAKLGHPHDQRVILFVVRLEFTAFRRPHFTNSSFHLCYVAFRLRMAARLCSVSLPSVFLENASWHVALRVSSPFLRSQRRHKACGTWQRCPREPQHAGLFKMRPRVPALKTDTSACAIEAARIFSFPPLADSCLSSASNFCHTFSSMQARDEGVCVWGGALLCVINTIVNCALKAAFWLSSSYYRFILQRNWLSAFKREASIDITGKTSSNYGYWQLTDSTRHTAVETSRFLSQLSSFLI